MSKQFEPLDPSDVISMEKYGVFKLAAIFKVSDVINATKVQCTNADSREAMLLSAKGVPCEVLRLTGGGWQKGRVRLVRIEFCPDNGEELADTSTGEQAVTSQSESPLDDIRRMAAEI